MIFRILCLAIAISGYFATRLDEANSYFDEVLQINLPYAVQNSGLEVKKIPNFTHNMQNRSSDGTVVNTKVIYQSGNLTGLQNAYRKTSQEPEWAFGNITAQCNIVFPEIKVQYETVYQKLTGYQNNVHFRQHVYLTEATITDLEASLKVSSSPHIKIPALKVLKIINLGTPSIDFNTEESFLYEVLSSHFYHKFQKIIEDLFEDDFRTAVEEAVRSVQYPVQ